MENKIGKIKYNPLGSKPIPPELESHFWHLTFIEEYLEERRIRGESKDDLMTELARTMKAKGLTNLSANGMPLNELVEWLKKTEVFDD